jgi:hypothetical protein
MPNLLDKEGIVLSVIAQMFMLIIATLLVVFVGCYVAHTTLRSVRSVITKKVSELRLRTYRRRP